jgi:hypothetical protein
MIPKISHCILTLTFRYCILFSSDMIICLQYVAIPSIYNLELNIAAKQTMNCMLELLNSSHMYYTI